MRTILHCDCNSFYASIEAACQPELKGLPVAVCGDPALRHGIILAKSKEARLKGVSTGEAIWQARQKCPDLILVPADQHKYLEYSKKMRTICRRYSPYVEPFGLDENWLDVSDHHLSGEEIACLIRQAAKDELGITASIGISFNKVFAKLGSDVRKNDAITVISKENYRRKVWVLPVDRLLFIGKSSNRHLNKIGIQIIGELAQADASTLHHVFGKNGEMMQRFARGEDESPVLAAEDADEIKSISNSTTPAQDLTCVEETKAVLYLLCESVAARLRRNHLVCRTVSLWLRDTALNSIERQCSIPLPSNLSKDIASAALQLLINEYDWRLPLRSIGVRGSQLQSTMSNIQLPLYTSPLRQKNQVFESALDGIRMRYGHNAVQRGIVLCNQSTSRLNPVDHHALQTFDHMKGRI